MGHEQVVMFATETLNARLLAVGELFLTAFCAAAVIERAFAVIFNHNLYQDHLAGRGLKAPLVALVSFIFAMQTNMDAGMYLMGTPLGYFGYGITGLFLAGGSKKIAETWGDLAKGARGMAKA